MNDLSWFLYLADVLPTASVWLGILFVPTGVIGAILVVCTMICAASTGEDEIRAGKVMKPFAVSLPILSAIFLLVSILIPSKETIYLIAGSEAGQYVVESETGQEILTDIKSIIKQQLSSLKGE